MRRFIGIAAVTAALFLAFPLAAVQAAPPTRVHFEIQTTIAESGNGGPFQASGPAVDAGLVCASGTTLDVGLIVAGSQSRTGVNFLVLKEFTCADGSGTFTLRLEVNTRVGPWYWQVVRGTDDYARLRGTGSGYSTDYSTVTNTGVDHLDGGLHVD